MNSQISFAIQRVNFEEHLVVGHFEMRARFGVDIDYAQLVKIYGAARTA